MDDFLYVLKLQLMDRITPKQLDEQMHIYEDFIQEEMAGGRSLESVLRLLGDPAKVADLIVENYEKEAQEKKEQEEEERQKLSLRSVGTMSAEEINSQIKNPKRGIKAEYKEDAGWDVRMGKLNLNTWYGRLLTIVVVVVLFMIFTKLSGK